MQPLLLLVDDVRLLLKFLKLTSLPHYRLLVLFDLLIFLNEVFFVLIKKDLET